VLIDDNHVSGSGSRVIRQATDAKTAQD